ncbi:MAG: FtsQ-type POTRA domain-containing protein, partial [Actinomycetes bacterium]
MLSITTIMCVAIFSSALAVTRIQVTGTDRLSAKSIQNALQGQLGVSLTQIDNVKVAAQLESFSLIESVDVIASPP